jgi:uncharacterized protein (TIGR01777 family)
VVLEAPAGPFRARWVLEHSDYVEGRQFRDAQLSGPFARWVHTHSIEPSASTSVLEDDVEYELPMSPLSDLVVGRRMGREIERAFRYRHDVIRADIERHVRFAAHGSWRIGITGATGLVGSALTPYLSTAGHTVTRFVRTHAAERIGDVFWNPESKQLNPTRLTGMDAIVHLAGEPIGHRWTPGRRRRISASRLDGTRLLARTIAGLDRPPRVMISGSAIGYYGDRGDEVLDEQSTRGAGFLAELSEEWEAAVAPARERGVRVVNARMGIVLSPSGGALGRMLTAFRLGVGGPLGTGRQWMSWIALDDVLGAVEHALFSATVKGAVNFTAPEPVTSSEFARTLGHVLHRPALIPVPAFALRVVFGEMADETLLASQRADPAALRASGFQWRLPSLERALRFELGA